MIIKIIFPLFFPIVLGIIMLTVIEKYLCKDIFEIKKISLYLFNLFFLLMPVVIFLENYFELHTLNTVYLQFLDNIISVAVIEEGTKLLLVLIGLNKSRKIINTNKKQILVTYYYAVISIMSFAMLENIVYYYMIGKDIFFIRAVTSLPMHFGTTLLIIYCYNNQKLLKGFVFGIIYHAFYNVIGNINITWMDVNLFKGNVWSNGVLAFIIYFISIYLMYIDIYNSRKELK